MFVGTKFIWNASSFIRNPKKREKIEVNTSHTADTKKTLKKQTKPNELGERSRTLASP